MSCLRLGQTTLSNSSFIPFKKFAMLNPLLVSVICASFFLATVFSRSHFWFQKTIACSFYLCITATTQTNLFEAKNCIHKNYTRNFQAYCYTSRCCIIFGLYFCFQRALEDLNPRHQVLETCVLPTELRAHRLAFIQLLHLIYLSLTQLGKFF